MSSKTAVILHSQVTNGVIPLPRGVKLAEGTEVGIVPLTPQPDDGPFLKGMLKLAYYRTVGAFAGARGHTIGSQGTFIPSDPTRLVHRRYLAC